MLVYILKRISHPSHRGHFRSDVLVSFNPPIRLTVKDTPSLVAKPERPVVSFEAIRSFTSLMRAQLSSNMNDAPSWDVVRIAKAAARIYAPFGTRMQLGDWVRVVGRFVEGFTLDQTKAGEVDGGVVVERKGLRRNISWAGHVLSDLTVIPNSTNHAYVDATLGRSKLGDDSGTHPIITDGDRARLSKDMKVCQIYNRMP